MTKRETPASSQARRTSRTSSGSSGVTKRSAGPPTLNVVCSLMGSSARTFSSPTMERSLHARG